MRLSQRLAAAVPNVKNMHRFPFNGEQNSIHMGFTAIEKLAYFKRKLCIFRSDRTALWKGGKRRNRILHCQEPPHAGIAGMLRQQPFENRIC